MQSQFLLAFITDGYFRSSACVRELLRAATEDKPIIVRERLLENCALGS